jgi:hypothetical protein
VRLRRPEPRSSGATRAFDHRGLQEFRPLPAPSSQPWAGGRYPFGIKTTALRLPSSNSPLYHDVYDGEGWERLQNMVRFCQKL